MPVKNEQDLQEMKNDLMKVYREVAPFCKSQKEAWRRTVQHPAPRYYVSEVHAVRVIKCIINGQSSVLEDWPSTVKRRYESLYRTVVKLSTEPRYARKSIPFLVRKAIYTEAPEFFITGERFRRIFYEERNKKYISTV